MALSDKVVGNLIFGQSGGPSAVINASLAGAIFELKRRGFTGRILGMPGGIEQFLAGREPLDLTDLTDSQVHHLAHTGAAALGSCRVKLDSAAYSALLEKFRKQEIHNFLYIGGNGSMNTPLKLAQLAAEVKYEMRCVGIPKTIDNDLEGTDHSPGYGSAARWLAQHTLDAGLDLLSMRGFDQVKIIEAMGRHCGWLAAASLLARFRPDDPPHLVLVPELIFNEQKFLAQVEQIYRQKGCVLVVASEGLRDGQGRFLAELQQGTEIGKDVNGQALLSIGEGVSGYLCNLVRRESGLKARYDKPGTLQRGSACRSSVDLDEAFSVGRKAGAYLMEGQDSVMPALKRVSDEPYKCEIEPVLLSEIAGREKRLPSDFFEDDGLSEAKVRAYAGPLIGPALEEPFRF